MALAETQKFKFKIIFAYLFILTISTAVSYFIYQAGNNISAVNLKLTEKQLPILNNLSELKHWLNEHERILYEHYATEDSHENIPKLILAQQNIRINLLKLEKEFPNNNNIEQLLKLNKKISYNANFMIDALDWKTVERWDKVRELLASVSRMGRNIQPLINKLNDTIRSEISDSNSRSLKHLSNMSFGVLSFSFVILIIALLVGYYIVNTIKTNFERRKLALFVEKSPNAIASIDWNGQIEFENITWRKNINANKESLFLNELTEKLKLLKNSSNKYVQWQAHNNGDDLEIGIHKISAINQAMVFVENITERVNAQKELEFIAYNDPLTGLGNVKKLESDIEEQLNEGGESKFVVLTIGMKQLKSVSTTHGYSVSDSLINALVIRIKKALLPMHNDFGICKIYRFNGAKLSVLIAKPKSKSTSKRLNDELIMNLNGCLLRSMGKPLQTLFGSFFLDFQTGCVMYPDHGYSAGLLIKSSNAAYAEAKKANHNLVMLFDQDLAIRERKRYQLENDLRAAYFDKEFYLLYQPKIDLHTNTMSSMEALIRWNHPEKGLISPVEFIPIAEESGIILALGRWVLSKACEQTKIWHNQGLTNLQVAVNVSPSQLLSASFLDNVKACLEENKLDAKYLEIEITEEVLADDQETCISVLNAIKEMGVSIAVDDFGTGYSSLGYLNKFPLSKLKIDRSFVTDIQKDKSNFAIVSAIIALSKNIGVKVIAEGIETEDELKVLRDLNCDLGQGYLFNKPLAVDDFSRVYL